MTALSLLTVLVLSQRTTLLSDGPRVPLAKALTVRWFVVMIGPLVRVRQRVKRCPDGWLLPWTCEWQFAHCDPSILSAPTAGGRLLPL